MPPFYDLKTVKAKIRSGHLDIKPNALQAARDDFQWGPDEIRRCLLKLNDRDHGVDPANHHFYKHEPHRKIPHTVVDYYKARQIMDGENVYIHLYIRNSDGKVIVNSFKELVINAPN